MLQLGLPAARRIAIAAAGLAEPRPATPTAAHLRRTIDRLGLLQIDSVSIVARAHYLPLFSRLGPYDAALLDALAWGRKPHLFEYWAHEASLLPLAAHPLFRWRMHRAATGQGIYASLAAHARDHRQAIEALHLHIVRHGPTAASDHTPGLGGWWGWSPTKHALEYLFWSGRLAAATRRPSFERVYDLPERVLPPAILNLPTPTAADAHRTLLLQAARALGIATESDLRDYHRLSPSDARPRLVELVESGQLIPAQVRGWSHQAYLHPQARRPRAVEAQALLAPFDPLVWHRPRAERLFDFHYRLEIYTPAARRQHGYYVLPFLLGDTIAARVDLKADRATRTLHVLAAWSEPRAPHHTPEALKSELNALASWLKLEHLSIHPKGNLALAP